MKIGLVAQEMDEATALAPFTMLAEIEGHEIVSQPNPNNTTIDAILAYGFEDIAGLPETIQAFLYATIPVFYITTVDGGGQYENEEYLTRLSVTSENALPTKLLPLIKKIIAE